jgi:molybdopterin-guanine dinucleotide biosynthesis protein A
MGSDKGLLKLEARTWAQTAMDKLAALNMPVVVSVNSLQYEAYPAVIAVAQLVKDLDNLDLHGPLAGVLSVHQHFHQDDLFVLACDMPLMETAVMQRLIDAYQKETCDAYVFTNNKEPEPLCGIYTAKALAATMEQYNSHQLTRHSMKFMLQQLTVAYQPIPAGKENNFRNFNAHAELNGL